ncbi:hypothetical protein [Pleurocapsa sp. PCC 7319]|uniref:hypothetical protein n=1 Tax=Pleurocapsa sp. PCC 7319 TaxID=118161 RepID=UPI0003459FB9|nr:hypothetical protein [Pleurocapsa sp. PCC 7319]
MLNVVVFHSIYQPLITVKTLDKPLLNYLFSGCEKIIKLSLLIDTAMLTEFYGNAE